MRVLLLTDFYAPIVGGEQTHVQALAHELSQRGHSVAVASLAVPGVPATQADGPVRVYRVIASAHRARRLYIDPERLHVPPLPDPEALLGLRRIIDIEKPDVVHAHNWFKHSFLPLKRWSEVPLVVTLHDYSHVCANKTLTNASGAPCAGPGLRKCLACAGAHYGMPKGVAIAAAGRLMRAFERRLVDLFMVVSHVVAERSGLLEHGLPFRVVPNFLADNEIPVEPPRPVETGFLLFVGDLRSFKGVHVLARAYARLATPPPLVLIGRHCPDAPARWPAGTVRLGVLARDAVLRAWGGSLFGLAPSVGAEPFGLAALEAMARGRPVIASRSGGLAQLVVHGETGLLVRPSDEVELAEAIQRLLGDPGMRKRMGQAAWERARGFRASAIVPRIEQVYAEARRTRSAAST